MPVYFGMIVVVPQEERAVRERFGKYVEYLEPGLSFKIPLVDQIFFRDIREKTIDIPPQSVITKDNVEVQVDGVFWIRVDPNEEDVKKSFYEIDNYIAASTQLAYANVREIVALMDFDQALTARQKLGQDLLMNLAGLIPTWGAGVKKVEIREIDPPADIKNAMHKQKTAEQERRAMKLEATGRKEAAEQDKEAAILKASGEKQSAILMAEGARQSAILRSEGDATAIKNVNEAAQKYFKAEAQLLKKLETVRDSLSQNSKIILAPGLDGVIDKILEKVVPDGKGN